jgi:transcriptional regulator with XRE-family HTH domain
MSALIAMRNRQNVKGMPETPASSPGALQRLIGRNLRKIRDSQGFSQEKFAAHLGYARSYMGDIERGTRNLTLQSIEDIAARTGTPALELLQPDDTYLSETQK